MTNLPQHVKVAADALSLSAVISTLFGWLPSATALLSFVWICIRLYETETVKALIARWRDE